ncbi:MAG: hypothetical protein ABIJ33_04130 [Patescibacteria group bacterium]
MTKLFKLSLLGFIFALIIALVIGTRSFNHYCSRVIAGDTSDSDFRRGIEEWKNCVLNTPTLNQFVFELGLYAVLFLIHVYLISQQQERNIFKNIFRICFIGLFLIAPFYLTGFLFPQISYGSPWEGGVYIKQGGLIPVLFYGSYTRPPHAFYFLTRALEILFIYVILQSGPLIMTLLLGRFHLSSGYKPGIRSFLYVLLGSILFELLALVVFFIGRLRIASYIYPTIQRPSVGPAPQIRHEVNFEKGLRGN